MCGRKLFLLFCVFGLSLPFLSYSQEAPSSTIYESELVKLKVISTRLQAISIQLDLKLNESEESLQALTYELESLKIELAGIRNKLTESSQESDRLAEMLAKSEVLLEKLTASFKEYKNAAETKIKRLDRKVKALTVLAGILAAGAVTALVIK